MSITNKLSISCTLKLESHLRIPFFYLTVFIIQSNYIIEYVPSKTGNIM